jgi:hypothetical protein
VSTEGAVSACDSAAPASCPFPRSSSTSAMGTPTAWAIFSRVDGWGDRAARRYEREGVEGRPPRDG